jgi:hypothetical protein
MRLYVLHYEMIRKVMSFPFFIKSGTLPDLLIYWLAAASQLNRGVSRFLAVFGLIMQNFNSENSFISKEKKNLGKSKVNSREVLLWAHVSEVVASS